MFKRDIVSSDFLDIENCKFQNFDVLRDQTLFDDTQNYFGNFITYPDPIVSLFNSQFTPLLDRRGCSTYAILPPGQSPSLQSLHLIYVEP